MENAVYTLNMQLLSLVFAIFSSQISFSWEKTDIQIQKTAGIQL